jgi:hypothetical protein
VINGASIPRLLWSIVGSPFVGDYRRASVLHDAACDQRDEPHELVHRMFYDASLDDGVAPELASVMYDAVATFGPRWDARGNNIAAPVPFQMQIQNLVSPNYVIEGIM